ncbi:MAG: aminoacetone oxidase family FAD-binding enzyme [Clostridiales bacterium]|nr:aminoacetone oxidase family FAD-binding enzyme [Candidatus Equinaster intestinalis]
MYDVAIVGAGAGGLVSAVKLKSEHPELSVVLLEKLDRVGKKLITTGNGRCNITNKFASIRNYHTENTDFVKNVFDRYFVDDAISFFSSIGTEIIFEEDGRGYPASLQASSVVDCLRFACEENGVKIITDFAVDDIIFGENITVQSKTDKITAKSVILSAGLYSGGEKSGSDGSIFKILKNKGFKTVKTTPSIVQLKTENTLTRQLKGIKVNAKATIVSNNQKRSEFGEVLFTEYGLSGPPILQISRIAALPGEKTVYLDLFPDYSKENLCELLQNRRKNLIKRKNENFLVGLVNKRVGQVVLKTSNIDWQSFVGELTDFDISKITDALKNLSFKVSGDTGFVNSQVTAGGISLDEIDLNMQSKKHKGLFLCGELLDVDGDCGGYNLQWAWSSSFAAADGVKKYLGV